MTEDTGIINGWAPHIACRHRCKAAVSYWDGHAGSPKDSDVAIPGNTKAAAGNTFRLFQ